MREYDKRLPRPEIIIADLAALGLLAHILLGAFSTMERRSIVEERDGGKCRAPFPHKCGGRLELHHICPQRYAQFMGLDEDTYDTPENSLTICANAHMMIHPDMLETKRQYHYMKAKGINAFDNMAAWRDEQLRNRQIYWNDEWDRQMRVVAMKRTQEAKKRGWTWMMSKKRVKRYQTIERLKQLSAK